MLLPHFREHPIAESVVAIDKRQLEKEKLQEIKRLLTFSNQQYFQRQEIGEDTEGVDPYIFAFQETGAVLWLPRHLTWQKLGLRIPRPIFPKTRRLPWELKPNFVLRDYQEPAFDALTKQLTRRQDGILVLSCGKGKTVLAVAGFCWMQTPTLAIVTQLFIGEQWKKELVNLTDIPEERIGLIGKGKCEWKDKDFVIATIQSLAQKEFPYAFYRRFGLIYYDEVHRLGAHHFGTVAPMFSGVRIGLTATLDRPDGMERMFQLHIGKRFYEDKKQELIPQIYFMSSPTSLDLKGYRMWKRRGKLNFAKIITHLSRDEARQAMVLRWINKAYIRDRKVMLLSDRKEELVAYEDYLKSCEWCGRGDVGVVVGSLDGRTMPQETREKNLRCPVILATAQLVKEGLDKKDIDTLIILYPKSSPGFAEQAVGRILRLDDEKKPPKVYIMVDRDCFLMESNGGQWYKRRPFLAQAKAMQRTFERLGYTIERSADD
jgi:superfamily II DNA or RNA helicase